jgi:site-specific DNA-methyltransferase (adenine-specific)
MKYQILQGDNRETLKTIADNSIDAIVTDPPYGIDFLGKAWDANTGALETYQECLRVLKPGGHILAFSAARTYHHLAVTLEQAGFEIRDQIMWIYSSGFPKSQDIGRSIQRGLGVEEYEEIIDTTKNSGFGQMDVARTKVGQEWSTKETKVGKAKVTDPEAQKWEGWGTALKPAHEPIALARKPIKQSIAKNCQQWGTGALNIDAARIEGLTEKELNWTPQRQQAGDTTEIGTFGASGLVGQEVSMFNEKGRFPSNVIGEIPDYQKYFYCPKVSRKERHVGYDTADIPQIGSTHPDDVKKHPLWDPSIGGDAARLKQKIIDAGEYKGNNHPTVKPVELMKYLIKLVTPPGGTVLDPFNGSGSTGMAAVELGFNYIGCELDPTYVEIAEKRIAAWLSKDEPKVSEVFEKLFE